MSNFLVHFLSVVVPAVLLHLCLIPYRMSYTLQHMRPDARDSSWFSRKQDELFLLLLGMKGMKYPECSHLLSFLSDSRKLDQTIKERETILFPFWFMSLEDADTTFNPSFMGLLHLLFLLHPVMFVKSERYKISRKFSNWENERQSPCFMICPENWDLSLRSMRREGYREYREEMYADWNPNRISIEVIPASFFSLSLFFVSKFHSQSLSLEFNRRENHSVQRDQETSCFSLSPDVTQSFIPSLSVYQSISIPLERFKM